MKIIEMRAENIKRLSAVEIRPDGNMVVIGGKNGAGKSSVLDAIMYALGGTRAVCDVPVHQGERKAKVELDLGDLAVVRTFTAKGGGTLTVKNKDGVQKSPQAILDRLVGRLSFDPLAFAKMRPADQRDALKGLVGLDFSSEDAERKRLYEERTQVNREVKSLEAQLEAAPRHPQVPGEEVKVSELSAELDRRRENNRSIEEKRDKVQRATSAIERIDAEIRRLTAQKEELTGTRKRIEAELEGMEEQDQGEIIQQIQNAEETNAKVRANRRRQELSEELEKKDAEAENLTEQIEGIDKAKARAMAEAKFPVEGLAFDTDGVLLNGLPFSQASQAEQLRVSVAMGLAMNPELRILLIRDGSLLDGDSLQMVADMATGQDAQVWIERVGEGAEVSVIIEDGSIKTKE